VVEGAEPSEGDGEAGDVTDDGNGLAGMCADDLLEGCRHAGDDLVSRARNAVLEQILVIGSAASAPAALMAWWWPRAVSGAVGTAPAVPVMTFSDSAWRRHQRRTRSFTRRTLLARPEGPSADESHQVGRMDGAPAGLGGLDQLEGHGQAGS
jgi:hypothetical protein